MGACLAVVVFGAGLVTLIGAFAWAAGSVECLLAEREEELAEWAEEMV